MRRLFGCCVLFVIALTLGCESGPQLHEVRGTIKYDGKAVPGAQIQFAPDDRAGDPTSAVAAEDGTYVVRLQPGSYTIRILAQKSVPAPPGAKGPSGAPVTVVSVDVFPESYNTKSQLKRTVKGPEQMDFEYKPN